MTAKRRIKIAAQPTDNQISLSGSDIVSCALRNDFKGVDKALEYDPDNIRAQWVDNGINALMAASGRGLVNMVDHLLAKPGIDLEQVDKMGKSAFAHAQPFPQVMKRLIQAKYPGRQWSEPGVFLV